MNLKVDTSDSLRTETNKSKETKYKDSYIFANIVLLVDKLFHFQTELLVGPLQLIPLVLGLLHTETHLHISLHGCRCRKKNTFSAFSLPAGLEKVTDIWSPCPDCLPLLCLAPLPDGRLPPSPLPDTEEGSREQTEVTGRHVKYIYV